MLTEKDNFMLVPLTEMDDWYGVRYVSSTFGYVVKTVDVSALDIAAKEVADMWRLIAGRVEWETEKKSYQIRVPLSNSLPEDYPLTKFTTEKMTSTELPIALVDDESAQFLEKPPVTYFRHPTTPSFLHDYASKSSPILSIHVSLMANCACVGVTVPHGIFDGTGMGQIIKALNCALNNIPWTPPSLTGSSIMTDRLKELRESESIPDPSLATIQSAFSSASIKNALYVLKHVAWEKCWHGLKGGAIFLGPNVVERIVTCVKTQAAEEGKGWVSTGDIVVAFLLKAAYLEEEHWTAHNPLTIAHLISLRRVLADTNPELEDYSHNAVLTSALPPLTAQQISSMSLYDLALMYRKSIDSTRKISFIQGYVKWLASIGGQILPPKGDIWLFSNQIVTGVDKLDLGSETLAFWHWTLPFTLAPDHTFILNKFKGGYIIDPVIGIRLSRWKAMQKVLESLQEGKSLVVV